MQAEVQNSRHTHDAFISYSRRNTEFAQKLGRALENYKPPKDLNIPQRHPDVFLDTNDFTGGEYFTSVDKNLRESKKLIVLCSPDARRSEYVNDEIRRFTQARVGNGAADIIPILVAGLPNNEAEQDGLEDEKAFPEELCKVMEMPLAADYRRFNPAKDKIHRAPFSGDWYKILADLYGLSRSDVEQRERKRQARGRRIIFGIAGGMIALLSTALVIALLSRQQAIEARKGEAAQRSEAESQRDGAVKSQKAEKNARVAEEEQRQKAQESARIAKVERDNAVAARNLAEERRREAVSQRMIAVARQLAAQAELTRNQGRQFIERSLLLSVESMKRVPTLEADLVLRPQLRLLPRPAAIISTGGEVYGIAFGAKGRLMATNTGKDVSVWELPTGRRVAVIAATRPVAAMAFSPDGSRLATGSGAIHSAPETYMVQIWDFRNGHEVARMLHADPAQRLVFSPNGSYLATAGGFHAYVWEAASGRPAIKAVHEHTVLELAVSPDGQRLATRTNRGVRQIWTAARSAPEPGPRGDVAFSPDWTRMAVTEGGVLRIVEMAGGRELARIEEPGVGSPHFVADGDWVAASVRDATIFWSATDGEEVARLRRTGPITISPDRRSLATWSDDGVVQVWTLAGEEVSRVYHELVTAVTFTPDSRYLVTANLLGNVRAWESMGGREAASFPHGGAVSALVYSSDGKYLITNSDDRVLRVWDASSEQEIARVRGEYGVDSFALSPDGTVLAVAVERETRLLHPRTGHVIARLDLTEGVRQIVFSSDSRLVATAGQDNVACVWEAAAGRKIATMRHDDGLASIAFSPDGMTLATSTINSKIAVLWDTRTGRERFRIREKGSLESLVFSPDGRYLTSPAMIAKGTVIVWDAASGREIRRLVHENVTMQAFSPDGRFLATGAYDGSAFVWRMPDGEIIARLPHRGVTTMTFTDDSTRLLTGSADGAARVWDVGRGRELSRIQLRGAILAIAVSPDGRYLTTGSDRVARSWFLRPADLIAEACRRLARNLTRAEWDQFVDAEPYAATCTNLPAPP